MPHPLNEAGRRLRAAIWSYKLGLESVDEFIADTDPLAPDMWCELAESLLWDIEDHIASMADPRKLTVQ